MNLWKYYAITHRDHVVCNPMSTAKLDELMERLRLPSGARVLEIASGKGEFLIRLAERYDIVGIGVDQSPYCVADARARLRSRVPKARLTFVEMDGAAYRPDEPADFHLAACIGAGWIFGGHQGTLRALERLAAPGGWVVAGEPYWRQEPAAEYLAAIGEARTAFGTHHENATAGRDLGLELAYTLVSSPDDWDRYEGRQWYAAEAWAREQPDDPDVAEVLQRVRAEKAAYLQWGRETLGWAIYLFRKAEGEG
ncbi:MAG: class I SAM-dependent methyltransferase [Acidobacteria bacterium]|nr:class I SAM-dependent methyltransferase [Acidobacteriota bacterium]